MRKETFEGTGPKGVEAEGVEGTEVNEVGGGTWSMGLGQGKFRTIRQDVSAVGGGLVRFPMMGWKTMPTHWRDLVLGKVAHI